MPIVDVRTHRVSAPPRPPFVAAAAAHRMSDVTLARCGGLGPARTLLSLAEEHGMGTIVGSMMNSPVGVPARDGITDHAAMVELAGAPGSGVSGVIGRIDT